MENQRRAWLRTFLLVFLALMAFIFAVARSGLVVGDAPAGGNAASSAPEAGHSPYLVISQPTASTATTTPSPSATPTFTPSATPTPIPRPVQARGAVAPLVSAPGAVVVDGTSGALLYEKNGNARRAPASITKIVTAIIALERGKLDDLVTVEYDPADLVDSTVMGVNPGDKITLEDLLYGLMLPSGNDAALAIANHIAGSEDAFVSLMNEKVAALGLLDSHFVNPHGLDAAQHYTSAQDITMVARYAMGDASFRKLAEARLWPVTITTPRGRKSYDVYNLNRLLGSYEGADGVKIGYTEEAGRTIVASATRDGHRVYATLLGSASLWNETAALLDYAFKSFEWPKGSS